MNTPSQLCVTTDNYITAGCGKTAWDVFSFSVFCAIVKQRGTMTRAQQLCSCAPSMISSNVISLQQKKETQPSSSAGGRRFQSIKLSDLIPHPSFALITAALSVPFIPLLSCFCLYFKNVFYHLNLIFSHLLLSPAFSNLTALFASFD